MADQLTPAEELRTAAKLMRERATEAEQPGYDSDHPGRPWCLSWTYSAVRHVQRNLDIDCLEHEEGTEKEGECNRWGRYAGYHIAGMHPGVALAVADWLDVVAAEVEQCPADAFTATDPKPALAVARAYQGTKEEVPGG
jgi:hypothetical protein